MIEDEVRESKPVLIWLWERDIFQLGYIQKIKKDTIAAASRKKK